VRTGWRALLCADLLQKLLLIYRPYEERRGDTEAVYTKNRWPTCAAHWKTPPVEPGCSLLSLRDSMVRGRDRFRKLAAQRSDPRHPLIGIVGEIFCRLNTFSNENLVECLEEYGAEAWISDLVEWIWYTNSEHFRKLKLEGRIWTAEALGAWVRKRVQKQRRAHPDSALPGRFRGPRGTRHLRDPGMRAPLPAARGRFWRDGAERRKGGVPGEEGRGRDHRYQPFHLHERHRLRGHLSARQPRLGGIPIRNFYFDGTQSDLDRDLGVYMELARSYPEEAGVGEYTASTGHNC
jgi:hypothetical protein